MSIVLSMTSSRNVEEVVLFLKKQLQKTQEVEFEKVCFDGPSVVNIIYLLTLPAGLGISTAPHSIYPRHGRQILRSRGQRCPCSHGVLRRFKQPLRARCRCLRPVCGSGLA